MPRLSWLAFAGNPFSEPAQAAAEARSPIQAINWNELIIEHKLGEGASGVISRAQWQPAASAPQAVAVKVFKGQITSDGLPHSEMVACISAGTHPNLIGVKGRLTNSPGTEGLVLALIDPAFRILAGPPSFASCTRDVYAPGAHFAPEAALRIAQGVAGAVAHLHARGILHGDVYAHNILTSPAGQALLSDFGAAGFFTAGQPAVALALQRLEVRAFGCLLEELLERTDFAAVPAAAQALWALQQQCVQPSVGARPLFREVMDVLAEVSAAEAG
ncbi:hypothetical protein GGU46_003761 [Hymenobacter latericoloratus]|nr:hypothetical protein [Hymenobacter latericoloratus]